MMGFLYQKIAKTQIVLISGAITIIIMFIIFPALDTVRPPESPGPIEFQLVFSKEAFISVIDQWGVEGVQRYVNTLWIDYIFPVAYAIFLSSFIALLTSKLYKKPGSFHIILFILPLIAGVLDWIENTLHLVLLADTSNLSESLIFLASMIASIKWGIAFFSILVIFYYIFRNIRVRMT
ncbi:MAG: hypothetical protein ACXQTP_06065 [Candidatus Methanofastidiosia archaeon]